MTQNVVPVKLEASAGNAPPPPRPLTVRAGIIALGLVLLWTLGACFTAVHYTVMPQQLLLIIGFGAVLTIFLLQFPRLFMLTLVLLWAGTAILMHYSASPDDTTRLWLGQLRSLLVVVPLAGLAWYVYRRPLKRGELVIIYACVVIAIPWCFSIKAVMESAVANIFELQRNSEPQLYAWAKQLPWWGPTIATDSAEPAPEALDAVRGFTQGNGGDVPWGLWWRPMLFWVATCLSFAAMLMGLLMMFRKRWIEHERLPFVWAQPALMLIAGPEGLPGGPEQEARYRLPRRLWIAFAAGLGLCLPGILFISPAGEALSTWVVPPWTNQPGILGGIDLTDLNILPGVNFRLVWGPIALALLLMFPLDVLMTVAVTVIFLRLLVPGLLNSMGLSTALPYVNQFYSAGLRFGGSIGLLIWSVWFNRRTIWSYVGSLWGGRPRNAEARDEVGRLPVLLVTLAGLAGFIVLGSYATSVPQICFLTALIVIFAFAQVRERVEGFPVEYDSNYGSHIMVSIQRTYLRDHYTLAAEGVPVTGNSWATHWLQWGFCGQLKSWGPHNMLLEAFKVAHEVGVSARPVALAIVVTLLLVAVVLPPLYLQLMYTYGFDNSYAGALTPGSNFAQWSERAASYGLHSTSAFLWAPANDFYTRYATFFNAGYGIVLVGILFYLRREYPRFPISPVGVVIAGEAYSMGYGLPFSPEHLWFSFLLAGVAKLLMFRWVGVRSFREKVQPVVIMILCGIVFGMIVHIFRHVAMGQGGLK